MIVTYCYLCCAELQSCPYTVNLAVALALECKLRVGLLDADVYGPSIPTLMKLQGRPQLDAGISSQCTFAITYQEW